jgi:zinc/manganese transport system ATP-binding protein
MTGTGVGPELIRLDGVTASYGHHVVLSDVSFHVHEDQFTGIVGPSGAGKTTLLRLILGTLQPVAGTVSREAGLRVSYVPQLETVNWNFPVTVMECVLMARKPSSPVPWASRTEKADVHKVLERLGIGGLSERHIRELSGGQQQRMFLARALLRDPQLLLMDEPTSGVDVSTRHDVLHLLADLHEDGVAIVLTTHDLNGMAAHLPHLVCVNHRIVAGGAPADVITPTVLEETFGARMEVLEHLGMRVVVDDARSGISNRGTA